MTGRDLGVAFELALKCAHDTLADVARDMDAGKWTDNDVAERCGALRHALRHLLTAVEAKPAAARLDPEDVYRAYRVQWGPRLDVAGVYREYLARWGYSEADARAAVVQEVEEALDQIDDTEDPS